MAFNRKLILQRAADARAAAAVNAALAPKEEEDDPAPAPAQARTPSRTRKKDPLFRPKPMDRLELWAPLSIVGVPITQASGRVVSYPSGTPCLALAAPRAAFKGKEMLLDVRVDDCDGPVEGWIRAAHARWAPQ
jgi:hypothetical protein